MRWIGCWFGWHLCFLASCSPVHNSRYGIEFIARIQEALKVRDGITNLIDEVLFSKTPSSIHEKDKYIEAIISEMPEEIVLTEEHASLYKEIKYTGKVSEFQHLARSILRQANSFFQQGKYSEALQEYTLFLQKMQLYGKYFSVSYDEMEVTSNRAIGLHKLHRYEEALALYDQALTDYFNRISQNRKRQRGARKLELMPYEPIANLLCGKAASLMQLGKNEEALAAYDKAIEIYGPILPEEQPGYTDSIILKGNLLLKLNRDEKALATYRQIAEEEYLFPADQRCKALIKIGSTLYKLARYDEAIQSFDEALVLDANNMQAWMGKAEALRKLGQIAEAEEALKNTKG